MEVTGGPTPRGVGGLKSGGRNRSHAAALRPTPRGVGGLKLDAPDGIVEAVESHPSRGGWIEIPCSFGSCPGPRGPTPRGVGGLKYGQQRNTQHRSHVPPLAGWVD